MLGILIRLIKSKIKDRFNSKLKRAYYSENAIEFEKALKGNFLGKADPNLEVMSFGYKLPVLSGTIFSGKRELEKLLIQYQCDVNMKDIDMGLTPIMWAQRCGDLEDLTILKNASANLSIKNRDGKDIWELANSTQQKILRE